MKKVEISETAVLKRLLTVDRLRDLCLSLMKSEKDSDAKKIEARQKHLPKT